jgi:hypothetical protein
MAYLINVRENRKYNQERTIQRLCQHWAQKTQDKDTHKTKKRWSTWTPPKTGRSHRQYISKQIGQDYTLLLLWQLLFNVECNLFYELYAVCKEML